jgi:hypothetical protein
VSPISSVTTGRLAPAVGCADRAPMNASNVLPTNAAALGKSLCSRTQASKAATSTADGGPWLSSLKAYSSASEKPGTATTSRDVGQGSPTPAPSRVVCPGVSILNFVMVRTGVT